jgi:hypothetical protein
LYVAGAKNPESNQIFQLRARPGYSGKESSTGHSPSLASLASSVTFVAFWGHGIIASTWGRTF